MRRAGYRAPLDLEFFLPGSFENFWGKVIDPYGLIGKDLGHCVYVSVRLLMTR